MMFHLFCSYTFQFTYGFCYESSLLWIWILAVLVGNVDSGRPTNNFQLARRFTARARPRPYLPTNKPDRAQLLGDFVCSLERLLFRACFNCLALILFAVASWVWERNRQNLSEFHLHVISSVYLLSRNCVNPVLPRGRVSRNSCPTNTAYYEPPLRSTLEPARKVHVFCSMKIDHKSGLTLYPGYWLV